jgi:hypothetical protein
VTYESGGRKYEINPVDGEPLIREVSQKVGEEYLLFRERGFWGVKNAEGKVLIKPQYVSMGSLGGDLFSARKIEGLDTGSEAPDYNVYAENIGVVNAANEVIMPFEYRYIESLDYPDRQTGAFLIGKSIPAEESQYNKLRYGIADRTGRITVPLQYESHFYMNKAGHAGVYKNGKHGVIDHTGKVILPLVYRSISDTSRLDKKKEITGDIFYTAEKDRLWGMYDATGKEIVPHLYGYIYTHIRLGWITGDSPDRRLRGAYNYRTGVNIPAIYDGLQVYDHILVAYRRSEGRGVQDEYDLFDQKGRKFATWHYRPEELPGGRFIVRKDVGKDTYVGVLDPKGKVLVEPKYTSMRPAAEGFLWVEDTQGRSFIIRETGQAYLIGN